jgi:hypothetical protein
MQKITVMGKDSLAKTAIIIALSPTIEVIDLRPEQINTRISAIKASTVTIYIDEEPDQQIIDRLHGSVRSVVLIAGHNDTPNINDLFIPITTFQNFATKGIMKEIRAIKEFIIQPKSKPKLNDTQQKVFLQLAEGLDLSDEKNWQCIHLSRSKFFKILEQLRMLYDVEKNWQLIQLAKDHIEKDSFARAS